MVITDYVLNAKPNGDGVMLKTKYLNKLYRGNEDYYQRFKYYPDIINVDKIDDIPIDYTGYIAVPITIIYWNDNFYEIYKCLNDGSCKNKEGVVVKREDDYFMTPALLENGKITFKRIIIKLKFAEYYKQCAEELNETNEASDGMWIDNGGWYEMGKQDYEWVKKHPNGNKTHNVYHNNQINKK